MRVGIAWSVIFLLAQAAHAEESCVECHRARAEPRLRDPVFAEAHGDHAGLTCRDCHGGEPDEPGAAAHDIAAGFVGRPDALGTLRVCGRCHDGTTDAPAVEASYRAGAHGNAVAAGRFAAVCTDCHGSHAVDGAHVSETKCIECHADAVVMATSGLPTDQSDQWARSVHGLAASAGNELSPACADCHDGHTNRAGVRASMACGQCHEGIKAAFDRGPHAAAFSRLGFLDCVECHGSHDVAAPDARLLSGATAVCLRCHGRGQEAFERVRGLSTLANDLDRARRLPRDDPRRSTIIDALHALDTERLSVELEGIEDAPTEARASEASVGAWTWELGGLALIVLALGWRSLRRRAA